MQVLNIDFRRDVGPNWVGVVVLVVALAGAAAMAMQYRSVIRETLMAEASLSGKGAGQRRKSYAPVNAGDIQKVALELREARYVAQQLTMPWDELFRSLEAADTPTIALLGIESTSDRQRIQISAEAKNLDAMLRYVKDLEERTIFSDVFLSSHQIQQQDPQRPVRFMLSATWRTNR